MDVVEDPVMAVGSRRTFGRFEHIDEHVLPGQGHITQVVAPVQISRRQIGGDGGAAVAHHPDADLPGDLLCGDVLFRKVQDLIGAEAESLPVPFRAAVDIAGPFLQIVVPPGPHREECGAVGQFLMGTAHGHGIEFRLIFEIIVAVVPFEAAFGEKLLLILIAAVLGHEGLAEGGLGEVQRDQGQILRDVVPVSQEPVVAVGEGLRLVVQDPQDPKGGEIRIAAADLVPVVCCKGRGNEGGQKRQDQQEADDGFLFHLHSLFLRWFSYGFILHDFWGKSIHFLPTSGKPVLSGPVPAAMWGFSSLFR